MKIVLCFAVLIAVAYGQGQEGAARRPVQPKPRSGSDLTECQRKRAEAQKKLIVGGLVPECDENGDYEGLQCHPPNVRGNKFCQCWRTDGTPITRPSTKIKACDCVRQRESVKAQKDAAAGPLTGLFNPDCHEDGTYKPKQCSRSNGPCWCVDPEGNELTKPSKATVTC